MLFLYIKVSRIPSVELAKRYSLTHCSLVICPKYSSTDENTFLITGYVWGNVIGPEIQS